MIAPEETTRFVIDWTQTFGEIPSGDYYMEVTVLDVFDRASVHPLLVKYQYSQRHGIEFSQFLQHARILVGRDVQRGADRGNSPRDEVLKMVFKR